MESVRETLAHFGLNESDIDIYLTLTKSGELDAGSLAKKSGVSRTTAHDSIKNLQKLNLIEHRKQGRNAYYSPAHPQQLAVLIEQKKSEQALVMQNMEETIRQLSAEYNAAAGKPGIRYFEGKDGLRDVFKDIYAANKEEVIGCVDLEKMDAAFPEYLLKDLIPKRVKGKLHSRAFIADSPAARELQKKDTEQDRSSVLVDKERFPLPAEVDVYDDKIAMLSFEDGNFVGTVIQNETFAKTLESLLELAWIGAQSLGSKK